MSAAPEWPLKKGVRIVEVEWTDSASANGWRTPSAAWAAIGKRPEVCRSVGYLWKRNARRLLLVQSQSGGGLVDEVLSVPVSAVVRMRTLATGSGW